MRWAPTVVTPEFRQFWTEYRVCVLSTVRPDGRPHAVAVGATLDFDTGVARVITFRSSVKVANVRAAGVDGALVSVSQVDGGRWSTVSGVARVRDDAESVADAVERYARRYREPRPNPERVAIEIEVREVLGRL
ncbi:pyridoxamine 5'-phosphate oxidase family protein [Pseudonocardia spinosispora]|uniref:pyridoxamine 5'-phosphate oxidase family protein n=1 Tax=Pseudonocardia spinosispora TaxID=103441 RepID=UPI00041513E6|nr:TIGR03618 family F420-dependent PPOX class oxidoreductase [Pseudonocardia spinosispora]